MEEKVSVLIKDPGKKPRHVNISTSEYNLHKYVGDKFEIFAPCSDAAFISSIAGYPGVCQNFKMLGHTFYGTVILIGKNETGYCDFPVSFNEAKKIFPELFDVKGV